MSLPAEAPALAQVIDSPARPTIGTEAVDKVVHAIRDHLDMDVAFVSEFRARDRVFRHVDARDRTPIRPGDAAPLENGYCQRVVDGRLPELMPDTARVGAAVALPETAAIPIGAHLSVPIRLADGRVFGTLCCFSFAPDPSLGERDLKMIRVFAELLADQIDRDMEGQREQTARMERITIAIGSEQPTIVYQPIFDIATRRIAGFESLSRFNVEPHQPPDRWFADAAQVGMGTELELAAIRAALRGLPSMPADTYLSVNCSPQTILSPGLALLLDGVDLARVVLEITEHDFIDDYPTLLAALKPLRAGGLCVAIDDAGAGYASLRHVLNIQPEMIKLDVSLTRNIDSDPMRRALASALIAFARESKARIVAEGIETAAELDMLKRLGASCAQGYFLARPMPLKDALRQPFPDDAMPAGAAAKVVAQPA
ncbi:MAG TPA: EAL domain-containing protein [Steroidobacteraceae bacterium]|nr:EAL domain-containing protein [Steroidobacteraceae bacterium]